MTTAQTLNTTTTFVFMAMQPHNITTPPYQAYLTYV